MKKFIGLTLSAVFTLSLVSCGSGKNDDTRGNTISAQQAETLMAGIKSKNESLSADSLDKLTYTMKTQMDDESMTTVHKFSKEDNYIYDYVYIENAALYDGYEEPYKEYLGTIHQSTTVNYFYIDSEGRAIDAAYHNYDRTMKNEDTGAFERTSDTNNGYEILAETLENSEQVFHNSILTQLSDMLTQMLNYSSQMVQTFEPLLDMSSSSLPGMSIEIKSNGDGHLYMKEDMSAYGMYYECEFNDYTLTYMKTVVDNTATGITAVGYDVITTEMFIEFGVCEITYPNLSQYTKK